MRIARVASTVLATITMAAGCAGPAPTDAPDASGAFPVTVVHGQGVATVPATPRRVVVLGAADAQIASALGAPVVGAVRNPSRPDGVWVGERPMLPASVRTLDSVTPNVEAVAALAPDLILMTTAQPAWGGVYGQLAQIAPTVSWTRGLLQDPGDDLVRTIGHALGRDRAAADLVGSSQAALAQFAAEHPALAGRHYAFGQFAAGAVYLVTAPDSPSAAFWGALGMHQPQSYGALPIRTAGTAPLSPERVGVLDDADLVVLAVSDPGEYGRFLASPLIGGLSVVREGRLHPVGLDIGASLLSPNPASTPTLLDVLRPIVDRP